MENARSQRGYGEIDSVAIAACDFHWFDVYGLTALKLINRFNILNIKGPKLE